MSTNRTSSTAETEELRRQLAQVQSEKRDLLGALDNLRDAGVQRDGK